MKNVQVQTFLTFWNAVCSSAKQTASDILKLAYQSNTIQNINTFSS